MAERPEFAALVEEPNQRRLLRNFALDWAAMSERVRPVSEILRTAKAVDPDMAAVRQEMEAGRYRYMHTIAKLLADRGQLLVRVDRAADIIWTLASPDVGRLLCDDRGWTADDYADWLEEMLAAALLPRRRAGRSESAAPSKKSGAT